MLTCPSCSDSIGWILVCSLVSYFIGLEWNFSIVGNLAFAPYLTYHAIFLGFNK